MSMLQLQSPPQSPVNTPDRLTHQRVGPAVARKALSAAHVGTGGIGVPLGSQHKHTSSEPTGLLSCHTGTFGFPLNAGFQAILALASEPLNVGRQCSTLRDCERFLFCEAAEQRQRFQNIESGKQVMIVVDS
jgi:hypothetical protein